MTSKDREIIENLLNGWTLKTLMEPDPAVETNGPAHLECLKLHSVIVKGGIFWGTTLHHHLSISSIDYLLSDGKAFLVTFLYSNIGGKRFLSSISENLTTHEIRQFLLPLSRYSSHHWVLIDDYEVIFDLHAGCSISTVQNAIRNNDDIKFAFLDHGDYWRICNVHIPYYVYETNKIYLQSEPFKIQHAFHDDQFVDFFAHKGQDIADTIIGGRMDIQGHIMHEQYIIDLDGCYTDMASQLKRNWLQAKEIKVFKRKLPEDVKKIVF
jgi:hypothetical protein